MSTNPAGTCIKTYQSRTPRPHDLTFPVPCALLDKAQSLTYSFCDPRLKMRQADDLATSGGLELVEVGH